MIDTIRNWVIAFILLVICVILLGLIYKIVRLEESNAKLRRIKWQYDKICTRYGGNSCE